MMARTNTYVHRIPLTATEVFCVCNALTASAAHFEHNLRSHYRINKATKVAWSAEAAKLRALSEQILRSWKGA